jgi:predicted PolB exonuclease-like 3'-5' exonuclease
LAEHVIVWDLETVPDLAAFAAAKDLAGKSDEEVRAELGDDFPKLIFHKIVVIGALVASKRDRGWAVDSLGAPNTADRAEAELIKAFVGRIEELRPKLISFNGASFDLPVLRYRAMVNRVSAPGLIQRPYFNRYTDDALDLCDALASFDARGKLKLHELCRALGLPGKPEGIDGARVEEYVNAGRIKEVADYCETDVVNTYRAWLRYELFRGTLDEAEYATSESNLRNFILGKANAKPYLVDLVKDVADTATPRLLF